MSTSHDRPEFSKDFTSNLFCSTQWRESVFNLYKEKFMEWLKIAVEIIQIIIREKD